MADVNEVERQCRVVKTAVDDHVNAVSSVIRRSDGLGARYSRLGTARITNGLVSKVRTPYERMGQDFTAIASDLEAAHQAIAALSDDATVIEIAGKAARFLRLVERASVAVADDDFYDDAINFVQHHLHGVLDDNGLAKALTTVEDKTGPKVRVVAQPAFEAATTFIDELVGDIAPARS